MKKAFLIHAHDLGEVINSCSTTIGSRNKSRQRRSTVEYKYSRIVTKTSSLALEAPWMSFYFVVFVLVRNIVNPHITGLDPFSSPSTHSSNSPNAPGPRGFRSLSDIYARTHEVTLVPEELMMAETDQPSTFEEAKVEYDEVFAPVARLDTIRVILALAAQPRGTLDYEINYAKGLEFKDLVGFTDSDHGGDSVGGKSMGSMILYLGRNAITWQSQKQKTVALSSCEAEFMAATSVACQYVEPNTLFVDNKSAIALMK
ncbi:hypothetical protein Tco_0788783 [Tanacetum coccineum]